LVKKTPIYILKIPKVGLKLESIIGKICILAYLKTTKSSISTYNFSTINNNYDASN